jgi:hypothetical protein
MPFLLRGAFDVGFGMSDDGGVGEMLFNSMADLGCRRVLESGLIGF